MATHSNDTTRRILYWVVPGIGLILFLCPITCLPFLLLTIWSDKTRRPRWAFPDERNADV